MLLNYDVFCILLFVKNSEGVIINLKIRYVKEKEEENGKGPNSEMIKILCLGLWSSLN